MAKKRDIPVFSSPIIETHCHLDYLKEGTPEEIFEKSSGVNIEKIITISVEPKNLKVVRDIAEKNPNIYCTQGIHPHDAKSWSQEVEDEIIQYAPERKVVAIGEIGLDYHYDNSPRKEQRDVFERQLEIAAELDLPVVIHSRDADEDTLALLKNAQSSLKQKGVIHSFTSGLELAAQACEWGYYLGFNGIITFKTAQNVRDALIQTPIEQVLLETDAPFLTPIPFRGRENAPFYLPFIAEKVAEVKELSIDEVLTKTYRNSLSLFKFP